MSTEFNPLGAFSVSAPILDSALAAARVFMGKLPTVRPGDITRVYLHQSAEAYGCTDAAYHAVISLQSGAWTIAYTHDVRDNARSSFNDNYAASTFHRNTGSVAVAVDGLIGSQVTPNDFGSEPIQMHELEFLCAAAAAFCKRYGIDTGGISLDSDPWYGEPNILTHAEAANLVGAPPAYTPYGPPPEGDSERWDLATLVAAPAGITITSAHATIVGNALRGRCHAYKVALL